MTLTMRQRTVTILVAAMLAIVGMPAAWQTVTSPRDAISPGIAEAAGSNGAGDRATVWGTIKRYTDDHIVVDGKTYRFTPHVVIDTYSLEQDARGNVRLRLDRRGRVTHVFFYGLDMPEVVRRYKM